MIFFVLAVPPPPPQSSGCFPSVARVSLENGKSVSMSELQKGDRVQTGRSLNEAQ